MEAKTNQSSFAALEVINGSGGTGGTGAFARAPGNAVLGISTFQNGAVGITTTLAFDYRIVAKPLGGQAPRLPIMQASTKSAPTASAMTVRRYSTGFVPPMVEPRLGSQLKSSNRLR